MKRLLSLFGLFLAAIYMFGQASISLNTARTAGGTETACQTIQLLPGFSFKATSSASLSLVVNPTTCDPFAGKTSSVSTGHNYIQTKTYTKEDASRYMEAIQYFDGLGRPVQTVQRGITPNAKDLVVLQEYDGLGRESNTWLPGISEGNGAYASPDNVKTSAKSSVANNDAAPYSYPVYEPSPLNRVQKQFAPGNDWHTKGKAVYTGYLTNNAKSSTDLSSLADSLVCGMILCTSSVTYSYTKNYDQGELYVTRLTDEDNNVSYEFRNKLDQVVLTRQINKSPSEKLDTYYVYDDFGNLSAVFPPRASDMIYKDKAQLNSGSSVRNQLAYLYTYDSRNRCTQKKLPGCDWIYYVYDKADRLIFTQDGEQKAKNEWTFSIPDVFGRIVLSGICKDTISISNKVVKGVYSSAGSYKRYAIQVDGVDKKFTNSPSVLTVNYYDNYDFIGMTEIPTSGTEYAAETGYGTHYTTSAKGLLTGTLTAQMTADGKVSTSYLYSVMYYDSRGRLIQTKSNNHLAGGIEKEYLAYDFVGNPTQKKHVHTATNVTTQTEVYKYTYDHAGRLLKTTHQLTVGTTVKPMVTLAENTYDELGRLKTTKKNNQANLATIFTYNVRSWTKSISSPLFKQTLFYNDSYGESKAQYSGNISAMSWELRNDSERGYLFTYDALSRLTNADYMYNKTSNTSYKSSYSYDKHGNIQTIQRYGRTTATAYGLIDNMTMTYAGNQLTKVEDAVATISLAESADFKNYSNVATEYTYNKNGALAKDLNKGITSIAYNSLNLPRQMDIKSPVAEARNEYTYSAGGQKLKVVQKWNPNYSKTPVIGSAITTTTLTKSQTTDYVGNMIYENGTLKRVLVDGGYYEPSSGKYIFFLTDHLGNNRVVADQAGTVIQNNHYYPFGMAFAATPKAEQEKQPYKYNGKELDQMHGLNLYDYSARYYEPAIGRFTTVDPLAEKYYSISPYVYVGNNPTRRIDPDGKDWVDKLVGVATGIATNILPGTTELRNLYTPNSSTDYNNALIGTDVASAVTGTIMMIGGANEIVAGGGMAAGGGALSLSGVGAPVGGTVAGIGGVVAVKGVVDVAAGGLLVANSTTHLMSDYNYGKKSNSDSSFGGGKDTNSKTSREAFRNAKDQNGVPRSQQPNTTTTVPDKNTGKPLKQYEFTNSKGEKVVIRKDNPVTYPDGGKQGPHFNAGKPKSTTDKLNQHHNYGN